MIISARLHDWKHGVPLAISWVKVNLKELLRFAKEFKAIYNRLPWLRIFLLVFQPFAFTFGIDSLRIFNINILKKILAMISDCFVCRQSFGR